MWRGGLSRPSNLTAVKVHELGHVCVTGTINAWAELMRASTCSPTHLSNRSRLKHSHNIMAPSTSPLGIDLADVRNGYPSLAKWIARDPDDEPLVFRKFGVLAARNISSLQCQMVTLGDEIEGLESEIRQSADLDTRRSLQRWEVLCERAIPGSNSLELQLQVKLKELKGLLKEYC